MKYNFDQIINRRDSDSFKWNAYPPEALPMWVADMDFVSPEPVLQALHARVAHGVFGYPRSVMGRDTRLQAAIVDRMQRLYGWQVDPEAILLVPGVVTGFNLAAHALAAAPGEAVLVQTPVYPPIVTVGKETQVVQQEAALVPQPDGSYAVDFEAFEAAITPATRLFILCNPHNPVGKVFTADELRRIGEICLRHNITIISDEIHCDLIYSGHHHTPIASLNAEIAAHTITLMAPSKTYNLAGLECSFAIIPNPELRKQYQQARAGLVGWVNLMGVEAALAAYTEGQEWLDQLLAYLESNRDVLMRFVQERLPGMRMAQPAGTYLAWLDCRQAGIDGSPYRFFLDKAHVALNDGAAFGPGGEGFVRLNFGCPQSVLLEGLERMEAALKHK